MSTLLLNLDFGEPPPKKTLEGNAKHRRFVKKRRFLERRGFLNKKNQPPSKAPKLHSEPPKKGEAPQADGTCKAPPLPKKKATASSSGSEQSLDKKNAPQNSTQAHAENKCSGASQTVPKKMVAIDCEMVGTGPKGHVSSLARCSIVNYDGDVLYDEYILPPCHIVDYRTRWSGIRKQHMVNATPFKIARNQILKILAGKVVVGHAVHNDFKALQYCHPKALTRDTSHIPLLNRKADCPENATVSLKRLTKKLLNRDIQVGKSGHSSVEDAQATMELYKLVEVDWEQRLAQTPPKDW
uniref:Interferon stimulated exonuclease protein 20 like 2 n=1 Tax=Rousettus aegyptiacus TaxID=9407 RepID=A0A7J8BDF5_ROUAE|nr:interferon stimulated exonuclease protein 20 like 2 [Rousettus aegyptiacus]